LYTRPLAAHERVLCVDDKTSLQPRPRKTPTRPAQQAVHAASLSPQSLPLGRTVFKVIQDSEFLVHRCDEHVNAEFREFLMGIDCPPAIIAQAGY
jgi:hypothetical protein